jgi:hypothetical protein
VIERLYQTNSPRITAFLLRPLDAAKIRPRYSKGGCIVHALRHILASLHREMELQFLVEFIFHTRAAKQRPDPQS